MHVQKEGHHTWVKELPVTSHRVTEAQAFNMPLVPRVRVISEFTSATGSPIVRTALLLASTTHEIFATTTKATSTFSISPEYQVLITNFKSTTTIPEKTLIKRVQDEIVGATTTPALEATSTRENGEVRLSRGSDGNVYAEWVGSFEQMPYYYCAASFPRYSTSTEAAEMVLEEKTNVENAALVGEVGTEQTEFTHPVQQIEKDAPCDRRIQIVGSGDIRGFEFFPGGTDFVILELETGIYVSEIDARAWQNLQPLLLGGNLRAHVENGSIYVYDGALIYQVVLER